MAGAASGHPHTTQGRALVVPWALIRFGHRSLRGRRRAHGGATYLPLDSARLEDAPGRVCAVWTYGARHASYTTLHFAWLRMNSSMEGPAERMRADRWMVFFSGVLNYLSTL